MLFNLVLLLYYYTRCLIKCNVYYTERVNGKFVDTIRHHGCRDISREIPSCSLRAAAGVADPLMADAEKVTPCFNRIAGRACTL